MLQSIASVQNWVDMTNSASQEVDDGKSTNFQFSVNIESDDGSSVDRSLSEIPFTRISSDHAPIAKYQILHNAIPKAPLIDEIPIFDGFPIGRMGTICCIHCRAWERKVALIIYLLFADLV